MYISDLFIFKSVLHKFCHYVVYVFIDAVPAYTIINKINFIYYDSMDELDIRYKYNHSYNVHNKCFAMTFILSNIKYAMYLIIWSFIKKRVAQRLIDEEKIIR